MKFKNNYLSKNRLLIYLFLTGIVFILSTSYFLVYRSRRSENVYVEGHLVKNINFPNTGIFWVPYWTVDAIKVNDTDFSPLGRINARVIDKETINDRLNGMQVNLEIGLNVIKNRSGTLLYKNKPLAIGSLIELQLSRTTISMLVSNIKNRREEKATKTIIVNTQIKDLDPWQANSNKTGSEIKNNKGEVLAKLVSVQVDFQKISWESASGQHVETTNRLKRDILATIELKVKESEGNYYFFGTQRILPNQTLYLPWQNGEMSHTIVSVEPK